MVLLTEKHGFIAVLTMNRPERLNAFNCSLIQEFDKVIQDIELDDSIRVIVVTGSGNRSFCAGADIYELSELSKKQLKSRHMLISRWAWRIATCKKPIIGAINGIAYGGGAMLSTLFDIRMGCEKTKFRFHGVAHGRLNSTWSLPFVVGLPVAKELLFTGRVVDADEALAIGLLNKLVSEKDLINTALQLGESIAANDPNMVQSIKSLLVKDIGASWSRMQKNESNIIKSIGMLPPQESFSEFLKRKKG